MRGYAFGARTLFTTMGNPRRDAFEYGALTFLAGSMAAAYGFLLAYASQKNPDGTRRKLPKVNLEDEVDVRKAFEDLKQSILDMSWDNSTLSRFTKPSPGESVKGNAANASNSVEVTAPSAGKQATK